MTTAMPGNRIAEIYVKGLRSLADVRLQLDGLTVLIGDNGSGKSSLIEACELLQRAASESFYEDLNKIHGGVGSLLRVGAQYLELGMAVAPDDPFYHRVEYALTLNRSGSVVEERLDALKWDDDEGTDKRVRVLSTHDDDDFDSFLKFLTDSSDGTYIERKFDPKRTALSSFGEFPPHRFIRDVRAALRTIDVHLPFDTTARWVQRSRGQPSPLRGAATVEPAEALSRFGANLPNAWSALKNDFSEAHWRETMDYVRLGLGPDVESVNVRADPGGGSIALRLKYAGLDDQISSFAISDGTLAYLAFVALYRLNTKKSLIAFNEPETHLHPELLQRVLGFFEAMAKDRPVLLATHSDRLLDGLSDPARSVVLCELDERRTTRLVRPDPEALRDWLSEYRGLGDVRGAGHAASILTRREGE
ncbi:AAA family ATPase [Sorangium sp. So ce131]|uniref:AAA family ATPase n=1 Tax=Sorangium sp. So ce131 TaxID=3133282 RepID=UPI003F5E3146